MSELEARVRKSMNAPSASSCWPIRASPISTISILCAWIPASISSFSGRTSPCRATPRWSSCPGRSRPSPTSPRSGNSAGTSTSGPICGAAAPSWESAAATRCLAAASPIRTASRDRPRRSKVSACSRSTPILEGDKVLVEVTGETVGSGVPFKGYEMHVGRTTGALQPLLKLANGQLDGAVSADGRVAGCYIHGLLADDRQRRHWLQRIGGQASTFVYEFGCRRHARPAGRPSREAHRLRPAARAGP